MRLSQLEIETKKYLARQHFGTDVQVFLFGSRTNDQQNGGDIDLFIRNQGGEKLSVGAKIEFLTDLVMQIGDQKVDVVLENKAALISGFTNPSIKVPFSYVKPGA